MKDDEYVKLFTERFNRIEGTNFSEEDIKKLYEVAGLNEEEINLHYVPEKNCSFKVGQLVYVVDWGKSYSTKRDFFQDDNIDPSYKLRYSYGNRSLYKKYPNDYDDSEKYKILYIKYDDTAGTLLALITRYSSGMRQPPVHLIEVNGLEAIEDKNSFSF